jgi:hypothetical protein
MALQSNGTNSLIGFAVCLLIVLLIVLAFAWGLRNRILAALLGGNDIFVGDYHPQWRFSVSQRARHRILVRSLPVLQYDPAAMALPSLRRWPSWRFPLPPGDVFAGAQTIPPPATHPPAHGDGGANTESLQCVICTEDFVVGDDIRRLPCRHFFHLPCIDPWLVERSPTCPLW